MTISLVAAVARNGVIGNGNRLSWRLSTDMKRFRALTLGKPLIMGRKTYQSIGKPLPGRDTIIVTRNRDYAAEGTHIAADIEAALALAKTLPSGGQGDIIIAGGGEIYAQTIDRADRLFITEVDLAPPGDAHFPPIDPTLWREVKRERPTRGERDEADFAFVDYERR
ncbi:MAG TPA: dihydrofolate reductase [Roseiarcus sp.]|jgi:dihydrofolate reductase|nr:dihydrofolate reductase [Roseiarcus sp.]